MSRKCVRLESRRGGLILIEEDEGGDFRRKNRRTDRDSSMLSLVHSSSTRSEVREPLESE